MVRVRQVANVPLAATVTAIATATTLTTLTITATDVDDTGTSECVIVVNQTDNVASLIFSPNTISDFTFTFFFFSLVVYVLGLWFKSSQYCTGLFLFREPAFRC